MRGFRATNLQWNGDPQQVVDPAVARTQQFVSITDFMASSTDVAAAFVLALNYLRAIGGGELLFPERVADYDVDIDGLGAAIDLDFNDLVIRLAPGVVVNNTSATGLGFFRFAGAAGNRLRVNFVGTGTLQSAATAGHMFAFQGDVGLGFAEWTARIVQLNPAASIIFARWTSTRGMFTNRFGGPEWEHGSGSSHGAGSPTVPMVDIVSSDNNFNANEFVMERVNVHHNDVPSFFFDSTVAINGAFMTENRITIPTVEQVRGGLVYTEAALGFLFHQIGFYDSDDITNHLIETGSNVNGRDTEQCVFSKINVISVSGNVIGVTGTDVVVTLTSAGTLATADSGATPHGFGTGQPVYISGANEAAYNGTYAVTVVDAFHFTYVFAGAVTPATGAITAAQAAMTIKLGSGDTRHDFHNIGGNSTSGVAVDTNNRGVLVLNAHPRCTYYRLSLTQSTVIRASLGAGIETPYVLTDLVNERTPGAGITLLGQNLKAILSLDVAVDLPNLVSGATALVPIAAVGVKQGDRLIFHPNHNGPGPGAPTVTADLVVGLPWISADDEISIIVHNPTGGAIDSSNRTWHAIVFRP